jgi:glycerol uptake facilitator-like aquaporin
MGHSALLSSFFSFFATFQLVRVVARPSFRSVERFSTLIFPLFRPLAITGTLNRLLVHSFCHNSLFSQVIQQQKMKSTHRPTLVAALAEFVGTFLFLFFAFSGTALANSYSTTTPPLVTLIFIALAFGTSLTANVWAFYRVSGGMFNPAVTLACVLVGGLPVLRAAVVVVAQFLGGIAAAGVVSGLFPGDMAVDTGLGTSGTSVVQGLFIEAFLTAELVFVILMLGVEKHKATFVAPVGVGVAFFLTQLVGMSSSFFPQEGRRLT